MSEIFNALRETDDGENLHLSKVDVVLLVEILGMVAAAIDSGNLWFNSPGGNHNRQYANFCRDMARKFANVKIEMEQ